MLFTTDASGLSRGISKARSQITGFASDVLKSGASIAGFWGGIGAAITGGGLAAFVKTSMDGANATRVLAERLGTSTEAMSRLQYAAKIADVDSESLAGGLEKMQVRLAEIAMTGEGKAADVLERMGLDAATLAAQDPAATFHRLLGAIEQIPNAAERAKVITDVFGKGAGGLANLVAQGTSGIAEMEAEADRLGVTLSSVDAAKLDEADDAMTRLWEAVGGVGRALATELSPYITAAAKHFTDMKTEGVNTADYIAQGMDWVTTGIGYVLDGIQLMEVAWHGARVAFGTLIANQLEGYTTLLDVINGVSRAITGVDAISTTFVKDLIKGIRDEADMSGARVGELWAKPWAHAAARELVDSIGLGAKAAGGAAGIVPSKGKLHDWDELEEHIDKQGEKGKVSFSRAMEFGTAEAANTILRTKFGGEGKGIDAVSANTKRAADLAQDQLDTLREIAARTGTTEDIVWSEFERS